MRTITAQVNRCVRVKTATGKWVPGQIASIVAGTTVNVRLASGATASSQTLWSAASPTATGVWKPQ